MILRQPISLSAVLLGISILTPTASADTSLLNVSYDVVREFYAEYNRSFAQYWKETTGETVTVNQSHGGAGKQARAVADGLEADVISLNASSDIDILHDRAGLIPADWAKRLPHNSSPTTSVSVFLVRKGNPKHIRDWDDLIKKDVDVIIPNPKTSGNARYTYLAAWGQVLKKGGDETAARDFVSRLFKNVPVLDTGGRGATNTFVQRGIGDVLITFENEVALIRQELGSDLFDVVYPPISILAENPVTVVDKVVDKRGTRNLAQAYLEYLYSKEGQEIAARHHLRPRAEKVIARHQDEFPALQVFTVDELFGGWKKAQNTHFDDRGTFDQIYSN